MDLTPPIQGAPPIQVALTVDEVKLIVHVLDRTSAGDKASLVLKNAVMSKLIPHLPETLQTPSPAAR